MAMVDRNGTIALRQFAHVRITNPKHGRHGETGTVVRLDPERRRIWVAVPGGQVIPTGPRSVEVLAGKRAA